MATYTIIGGDGKEYGSVTADQLRQWIADGRANAQTRMRMEGATEWKSLAEFPELHAAFTAPAAAVAAGHARRRARRARKNERHGGHLAGAGNFGNFQLRHHGAGRL